MAGAGGVGIGLFGAVTGVAWLGAVVPVAGLVRNGTRTATQAEKKGFAPIQAIRMSAVGFEAER